MGEGDGGFSLIKIDGAWAEPANTLIKKVSGAIEGVAQPWQMKRLARAKVEEEKILAFGRDDINYDLQQRAGLRFMSEEIRKQMNMESITEKALPLLEENAKPDEIEDDWIANFFDKCRLISDEEMQKLWAKILAGEANTPGKYSSRTVNFLSSFDKNEAKIFQEMCSFVLTIGTSNEVVIFNPMDEIYKYSVGFFSNLLLLDSIGLISFTPDRFSDCYTVCELPQVCKISYFSESILIQFQDNTDLRVGKVIFTTIGSELFPVCEAQPVPGFFEYVIKTWENLGLKILNRE